MDYERSRRFENAAIIIAAMTLSAGLFMLGLSAYKAEQYKAENARAVSDAYIKSMDAYQLSMERWYGREGRTWSWEDNAPADFSMGGE